MWELLKDAPERLDSAFFQWVRAAESTLGITFADWDPSDEERQQIEHLVRETGETMPKELGLSYDHVYPFDHVKSGAAEWAVRSKRYAHIWTERLQHKGVTREQADGLVSSAPFLWPIDCFHRFDTVAFRTLNGILAVIQIDSLSAQSVPVALGLRNYFLAQLALQILAHEADSEPAWAEQRSHPAINAITNWPETDPPLHVCMQL